MVNKMNYVTREEMIQIKEDRDIEFKKNNSMFKFWGKFVYQQESKIQRMINKAKPLSMKLKYKIQSQNKLIKSLDQFNVKNIKFYYDEDILGKNYLIDYSTNWYDYGVSYNDDELDEIYMLID